MKLLRFILFLVPMLVPLGGCVGLDARPETVRQKLAVAESQFTAVVQTAVDLRKAGLIDAKMYVKVDRLIKQGSQALEMAHTAMAAGDVKSAEGQLKLLNSILWQLRTELNKAEGKKDA